MNANPFSTVSVKSGHGGQKARAFCYSHGQGQLLLSFQVKLTQGRLSGGIDAQTVGKIFFDRPVPLLHLVEGCFQVFGLHTEDRHSKSSICSWNNLTEIHTRT